MSTEKTTILIADDHPIVRQGLRKIIDEDRNFKIVGEVSDGKKVLSEILSYKPAIVLLDISLPGMNGLEIIREAKREKCSCSFIVLTMYRDREYFEEAISLGAKGYILKDNTVNDLLACIRAVARGNNYITPELSGFLLDRQDRFETIVNDAPGIKNLTPSERKVLRLIAMNKTSKEIAAELFISTRTVQNHRQNISEKLGLRGHHKLLQFALENKLYL